MKTCPDVWACALAMYSNPYWWLGAIILTTIGSYATYRFKWSFLQYTFIATLVGLTYASLWDWLS